MTLNDKVYRKVAEEFNVPWQVVRQIMESAMSMLKEDISSDEHWGVISFPGVGKFHTSNRCKKTYPDNDLKVVKGIKPVYTIKDSRWTKKKLKS